MHPQSLKYFLSLLSFLLLSAAGGCSQIDTGSGSQASIAGRDQQPVRSSQIGGAEQVCSVFVYDEDGKPERFQIPLESTSLVQEALEKTGAIKNFRRMKVFLIRKSPITGHQHKLEITYLHSRRHVAEETNYGLLAGDQLFVKEDKTTRLDDLINTTLSPLGRAMPQRR